MVTEGERRLILDMVAGGKITAEEGARLLEVLESPEAGESEIEPISLPPAAGRLEIDAAANTDLAGARSYSVPSDEDPDELAIDPALIPAPNPPSAPPQAEPDTRYDGLETSDADPATAGTSPPMEGEVIRTRESGLPPSAEKWRRWYSIPLAVGAGLTVLGGALMFAALQGAGLGFLFFCAWIPFLLGVAVLFLGGMSQTIPWLHVRVKQAEGEWPSTIALSFPLPIRPVAWVFRTFGDRIRLPGEIPIDAIILALEKDVSPENPIYIEVDDDGDHVEVFIG